MTSVVTRARLRRGSSGRGTGLTLRPAEVPGPEGQPHPRVDLALPRRGTQGSCVPSPVRMDWEA